MTVDRSNENNLAFSVGCSFVEVCVVMTVDRSNENNLAFSVGCSFVEL